MIFYCNKISLNKIVAAKQIDLKTIKNLWKFEVSENRKRSILKPNYETGENCEKEIRSWHTVF